MGTQPQPAQRPDYLDWDHYVHLSFVLADAGFGFGFTPSHLLIGDYRVRHDECRRSPGAVALHVAKLIAESGRGNLNATDYGFPPSEFTIGGQHISERSG